MRYSKVMRWLPLTLIALIAVGCSSTTEQPPAATGMPTNPDGSATNAPAGADTVAPMTSAPAGVAPVTGSESVDGAGSAVGQVAKDRAKSAAAKASGSSAGSESEGE